MSDKLARIREQIRKQAAKGGGGARVNRMLWPKDGEKYNVRFLHELIGEEENELCFYDKYSAVQGEGINVFGPENWGGEDEQKPFLDAMKKMKVKPQSQYMFLVWNYDEKAVQIVLMKPVASSFLNDMADWYEKVGTIMDRDYVLKRTGSGPGTAYSAQPELNTSPVPKAALEDYATFGFEQAKETLRLVYKIPDAYVSEEEFAEREAKRIEREEKKKEFEKGNKGEKIIKAGRTEKGANPWDKKKEEKSAEDEAYLKRKQELDSYDDEDEV